SVTAAEMLEAAGAKDVTSFVDDNPPGLTIHEMGTARMGRDPKTSVLNAHNQCHDVKNLFVTDGACMASSANQNPSISYMADAAPVIGHRYLVLAWIPAEERHTLDDYKRWAERLNRAGTEAKAAGLQFAYHNHDFEFAPLEGKLPYDVLLAETDPKLVQLEVDLYWITKGGQDPLAYFARWPGRFPMVHVKDSAGPPDHRIVEVGAGKIDFKKIFAQSDQAGIKYYFVEHDEPADAFASIRASCEYLKRLEF